MTEEINDVRSYFREKFVAHGDQAIGVDWNSAYAQEMRFDQVLKVIVPEHPYTILDYGSGYGYMAEYMLQKGFDFQGYAGYDIVSEEIEFAKKRFAGDSRFFFTDDATQVPQADYVISSGIFNIKLNRDYQSWTEHVLHTLEIFNQKSVRGFSSNFLTSYSDPERMAERPDLYFADPCMIFDYCRRNFSRNVALLHDYKIWDFTIIVRKEFDEQRG